MTSPATERLYDELAALLNCDLDGRCRRNELLSNHTSFKIGGSAALWVELGSLADLRRVHELAADQGLETTILGRGTNILASDTGYAGICLVLGSGFREMTLDHEQESLRAGAGAPLARLLQSAQHAGLSGLEFCAGIPGTFGAAVAGNVGTRDEWIGACIREVTVYDPDAGLRLLRPSDIQFQYRSSSLRNRVTILGARLALRADDARRIARRVEGALARRKATQPLFSPNAGSIFKNPEGASAGDLIEKVGMKGARCGGAQVSKLHANFIINRGDARAIDVMRLIREIRDKVLTSYDIELRPEIQFLGTFDER
ncbi:MAG: UDP-N-acetylmuramate dehydrogenase [Actinomycetia bacterium]|nr:UDP-N-acetylmuramate dehydrogenase [Actinomycetes bacterium]